MPEDRPADGTPWAAELHQAIKAIALDHPDLGFLASLLSHALKHGGLTEKQATYAERALGRLGSPPARSRRLPARTEPK